MTRYLTKTLRDDDAMVDFDRLVSIMTSKKLFLRRQAHYAKFTLTSARGAYVFERHRHDADGPVSLTRRRLLGTLAAAGGLATVGTYPRSTWALKSQNHQVALTGTSFDLAIGATPMSFTGRVRPTTSVNAPSRPPSSTGSKVPRSRFG
ncbi:twin-arginine translocation signal domain-containing protein [Cupriavidus necator]